MDHRVMFPDFSAFQIDIPHGAWPHEASWQDAGHSAPDLYSAFWPEYHARNEPEAVTAPAAEE